MCIRDRSLKSLDATAGTTIAVNGGSVTTSGKQEYHSAVTVAATVTGFTSTAGALLFDSTLTGVGADVTTSSSTGTTFGGLTRVLGNASYTAAGLLKPTFTSNADGTVSLPASSLITVNNGDTRWRIQGGIKLKF